MPSNNQINSTQLALTPAQIMQLPPDQQAQYLQGLSPQMQSIYATELQNMGNADFMRNSIERVAYCPVTGGSGNSASYSNGTTLSFDLPTTMGFARALLITYNLTITPATGSAATYATTPSAPFSVFSRLELDYNGPQIVTHPYMLALQDQLDGWQKGVQNRVLAGTNDSAIAAQIVGSTPLVVNSGNTWQGKMLLRLAPLSHESPYGMLPLNGVGNRPQLKITCAPNIYGTDPLLNAVCSGGSGTGQAVTCTGTVNVDCVFLDGTNMESTTAKVLQGWQGMPTVQYYWEQSLTPFNANTLNRFTVATKLEHWNMFAIVIDGQQSNAFISGYSNLSQFGLSPDPTGQQWFMAYNVANNISIYDFFDRFIRRRYGQDVPEGVIPWVNAARVGVVNASNGNGSQYLNMYSAGFPATTHIYQVGTVGSVCTPRVELFLVSKNNAGLKIS